MSSNIFTPETIATVIGVALGAILSTLGWIIVRWLNRKKPRTIQMIKWSETSLLEIKSEVKKDVVITYKGKPVETLYLSEFVFRNNGSETIDDVEINFDVVGDIIETHVENSLPKRTAKAETISQENIQITIPFLNPEKLYDDKVRVRLFSLTPLSVKKVSGGGREWKVEFIDRNKLVSEFSDDLLNELSYYTPFELVRNPVILFRLYMRFAPKILSYLKTG